MSFDLRYAVFKVLYIIARCYTGYYQGESGSHLLFHTVSSIVPSAAYVFTVVFGMGTGVARKRIATGNSLSPQLPPWQLNDTIQLLLLLLERR